MMEKVNYDHRALYHNNENKNYEITEELYIISDNNLFKSKGEVFECIEDLYEDELIHEFDANNNLNPFSEFPALIYLHFITIFNWIDKTRLNKNKKGEVSAFVFQTAHLLEERYLLERDTLDEEKALLNVNFHAKLKAKSILRYYFNSLDESDTVDLYREFTLCYNELLYNKRPDMPLNEIYEFVLGFLKHGFSTFDSLFFFNKNNKSRKLNAIKGNAPSLTFRLLTEDINPAGDDIEIEKNDFLDFWNVGETVNKRESFNNLFDHINSCTLDEKAKFILVDKKWTLVSPPNSKAKNTVYANLIILLIEKKWIVETEFILLGAPKILKLLKDYFSGLTIDNQCFQRAKFNLNVSKQYRDFFKNIPINNAPLK